jgi:hypothetical protein
MDDQTSGYWVDAGAPRAGAPAPPAPLSTAPRRSLERTGQVALLILLTLFLVDTFLPWQRACLDVGGFGFHIAGCFSANAWSGTAAHVGQAAGVFAIAAIVAVGLGLGGVQLAEGGRLVTRVGVYGTAAAGGLKWLLVIGKVASYGSWIGVLLLLAIAILESVDLLGMG